MHSAHSGERVVVTGMGAVSALGTDVEENWASSKEGRGGIRPVVIDAGANGPPPQTVPLALVDCNVQALLEEAMGRRVGTLDITAVYALKAVHEALGRAGLIGHEVLETRTAVVLGHGTGGVHTLERAYERFYGTKSPRPHPLTIPRAMLSAATSAITMEFGIKGPAFAISSACSSSGHSIAMGALMIKSGLVDVVIVGGSEAMASAGSMRAWESLQAISPTSCRPFSAGRDGTVIGEGAAALILESGAYARSRGARVLSELRGIGMSSDASHLTQPHAQGAIAAMTQACRGADVTGKEVLLVAAHGTGTTLNDKNEAQALREVFGDLGTAFRVIATKSGHGHLLGGSTALQAVLGLKALAAGVAPPILNYLGPDPQCDLDLVLGEAQPIRSSTLLVNSFAFGGLNTSLVFGV